MGPSLDRNLLESRPFRVVNWKQPPAMQLGGFQWAPSTEAAGQNLNSGPGLREGEGHIQGPITFPSLAFSLLSSILLFSISTSSLVPLSTMTSSSWKAAPHWRAKERRQIRHHAEGRHPWTLTLSPTAAPPAPGKLLLSPPACWPSQLLGLLPLLGYYLLWFCLQTPSLWVKVISFSIWVW